VSEEVGTEMSPVMNRGVVCISRTPPEVVANDEEDQEEVMMADLETILVEDAWGSSG
jgi:hypothetical protein